MAADDASSPSNASPRVEEVSPMSSPPRPDTAPSVEEELDPEQRRVEEQEAMQYWGYLVKNDKCGSNKLNSLLAGIAHYISNNFEGIKDCTDLTPVQLAAFYRAVGGNYDVLFVETQASSIAFIYKALGCLHSIQPADPDNGHATPTVPSLKPRGFVAWQTIQLLLGPEEHVPFLQSAVEQFDIFDPETGEKFPKILPSDAFPAEPDLAMTKWYDDVYEKLQRDMQSPQGRRSLSISDTSAGEQSGDEKFAASYFQNPMFRDKTGRPTVVRNQTKTAHNKSPKLNIADRGRNAIHKVRHIISPPTPITHHNHQMPPRRGRHGAPPDRYRDDDDDDEREEYEDVTPTGLYPEYKGRPSRQPRKSNQEVIESDSESDDVYAATRPHMSRRTSSQHSRTAQSRSRERRELERELERQLERERVLEERQRELKEEIRRERERDWDRDGESPMMSPPTSPTLRHRRSHEPTASPRDYFPPQVFEYDGPRRHSHSTHGPHSGFAPAEHAGGFAPSTEPSMASRVSKMQQPRAASPRGEHLRPDERGPYNSNGGRPNVRYVRRSADLVPEPQPRPTPYERRNRSRDYAEDQQRVPDVGRSRSYDRDSERERERDFDRARQSTRYVQGAAGRKYPTYDWRQ